MHSAHTKVTQCYGNEIGHLIVVWRAPIRNHMANGNAMRGGPKGPSSFLHTDIYCVCHASLIYTFTYRAWPICIAWLYISAFDDSHRTPNHYYDTCTATTGYCGFRRFQHCKVSPKLPVLPTNLAGSLPSAEAAGTGVDRWDEPWPPRSSGRAHD